MNEGTELNRISSASMTTAATAVKLKLAVIGVGGHPEQGGMPSTVWMETLAQSVVGLEAVCIHGEQVRAQEFCRRFAGRWPFASVEQLLKESEFDLAVLFAPLQQREEWVRLLLKARRAVLVSGLPAEGLAGARRLLSIADKVGCGLLVGWPMRFSPALVKTRQLLRSGRVGRVSNIILNETVVQSADAPQGHISPDALASAMDRVVQLAGLPTEVFTRTTPLGGWMAILTYADGMLVNLVLYGVRTSEQTGSRMEVRTSEDGYMTLDQGCQMKAYAGGELIQSHAPHWLSGGQPRVELGYSGLLAEALSALHPRRATTSSLHLSHWLDTWRVLDAVVKSAETGKAVRL